MKLGLENRIALVTGGTQGIGYGIAEALVREGASVIINARNAAALESAKEKINSLGHPGKIVASMWYFFFCA